MKIAVVSDFHLGAKEGTEREQDSFLQSREAIETALEEGAQVIFVLGDIFDSRNPEQEVWSDAMKILSLAAEADNRGVRLDEAVGRSRDELTVLPLRGVPVVAIHGNHERRGRGFVDSVEALESSGLLIKLHHNGVVFEEEDEKVAVHGMGYVPKQYAKTFIDEWDPEPVDDAVNLFLLHQGLGQFSFSSEGKSDLKPADLFEGFDLYLSGHVHYKIESDIFGEPLLFPGSTFRTQLLPIEAEKSKGFYMIEVESGEVDFDFIELDSVRDFYYGECEFDSAAPTEVEKQVRDKVNDLLGQCDCSDKPPLVRILLEGTLERGVSRNDIDFRGIMEEFEEDVLLKISRSGLISPDLEEKSEFLKDIREENISMEERGLRLLESNLDELEYDEEFDARNFYDFLSNGDVDGALEEVLNKVDDLVESGDEDID